MCAEVEELMRGADERIPRLVALLEGSRSCCCMWLPVKTSRRSIYPEKVVDPKISPLPLQYLSIRYAQTRSRPTRVPAYRSKEKSYGAGCWIRVRGEVKLEPHDLIQYGFLSVGRRFSVPYPISQISLVTCTRYSFFHFSPTK